MPWPPGLACSHGTASHGGRAAAERSVRPQGTALARYKVLGAVAHNIADSFTSSLNYARVDYVMGEMLTLAPQTGHTKYFIDFVSGKHSPAFDSGNLLRVVPSYNKMFWDNVKSQGSDVSFVTEARLEVDFDLNQEREFAPGGPVGNPYKCRVILHDNRGIDHSRETDGWWWPEPAHRPTSIGDWIQRIRSRIGV